MTHHHGKGGKCVLSLINGNQHDKNIQTCRNCATIFTSFTTYIIMSLKTEVLAVINYHISNIDEHISYIQDRGDFPGCISELTALKTQVELARGVKARVESRERL